MGTIIKRILSFLKFVSVFYSITSFHIFGRILTPIISKEYGALYCETLSDDSVSLGSTEGATYLKIKGHKCVFGPERRSESDTEHFSGRQVVPFVFSH